MTGSELAVVISAIFAGIGALASTIMARRSADVSELRAEVESLREAVNAAEGRAAESFKIITELRDSLDDYRIGISLLIGQLLQLGHLPIWTPRKDDHAHPENPHL